MGLAVIDTLPDECLGRIFQFLPCVDRIRLPEVRKVWQEVSDRAWDETKSLDFSSLDLPRLTSSQGIVNILKKHGHRLEHLNIEIPHWMDNEILSAINEYCTKLTSLGVIGNFNHWVEVKPYFPHLKYLKVSSKSDFVPEEVFQALPKDSLTGIELGNKWCATNILSIIQDLSKLESIRLMELQLPLSVLTDIFQLSNLKCLDLWKCDSVARLPSLRSLTNLEKLNLGNIKIKDETLIDISESCKDLKELEFHSLKVTDQGLLSLKSLTKLKKLTMDQLFTNAYIPIRVIMSAKELMGVVIENQKVSGDPI